MTRALSFCVAGVILAACGGSQPPISAPGAMPQSRLYVAAGRVLPATSSSDSLLYASGYSTGIYMLSYPSGQFVGEFGPGVEKIAGMCPDAAGDVYVVGFDPGDSTILEFAHGGTKSIWSTQLYSYMASSCAVDPTTGNLAVDVQYNLYEDEIAIYPNDSGSPTLYSIPNDTAPPLYCAYDDAGDLFAEAYENKDNRWSIAELPAGGSAFTSLPLSKPHLHALGPMQWASPYLAVAAPGGVVYHFSVSTSGVKDAGRTIAAGKGEPTWIEGSDVLIGPYGRKSKELAFWNYPQGGKPVTIIPRVNSGFKGIHSVLVSSLPTR